MMLASAVRPLLALPLLLRSVALVVPPALPGGSNCLAANIHLLPPSTPYLPAAPIHSDVTMGGSKVKGLDEDGYRAHQDKVSCTAKRAY